MSADLVMRTVGVLACATTLSLFSTIAAFAAVNVAPLKWDGSFCSTRVCDSAVATRRDADRPRIQLAKLPARSS